MSIAASLAAVGQAAPFAVAVPYASLSNSKSAEMARLTKAAGEFESILLQTLWKSMKDTFSDPNDNERDSDPISENYGDLGMQALSGAVGDTGALGIKALILKHL